jgi:hypothetical protein
MPKPAADENQPKWDFKENIHSEFRRLLERFQRVGDCRRLQEWARIGYKLPVY